MKKKWLWAGIFTGCFLLCMAVFLAQRESGRAVPWVPGPQARSTVEASQPSLAQRTDHGPIALQLMQILDQNPALRPLLETSIAQARQVNPDPQTNPAQNLEAYYAYLDWCTKAMPWDALQGAPGPSLFEKIDQSLMYFYFLLDQPLPELAGRGYYYPSLQYVEAFQPWLAQYAKTWGAFLSTEESWKPEYVDMIRKEARFGLDQGWYEAPENWHSFNDFFARRLRDPSLRPIAAPDDEALLVSPADSAPQGLWRIDQQSGIVDGVQLKSTGFFSVESLLGEGSAYGQAFAGGTLTHTFLNVDDYHRFHFPLSGVVREAALIPAQEAAGGVTLWDPQKKQYRLESKSPGWQSLETRARVVLETKAFGLVALLPIGMSQVSSILLEESVKVGAQVKKGDMLGCFQFGGSDFVMVFGRQVKLSLLVKQAPGGGYAHVLMGEPYARLEKATEQTHQKPR